jgi:hypothetical protein
MTHFTIFRDHKPTAKTKRPEPAMIACACNCGELIPEFDGLGRARRFALGHNLPNAVSDGWSEGRKAKFRQLWIEGKTCREIAEAMEMPRNSVPGKAQALKLPGRGSPIKPALNLTWAQRQDRKAAQERVRSARRRANRQKSAPQLVVDNTTPNVPKAKKPKRVPRMVVDTEPSRNLVIGQVTREICAYPTTTEPAPTHSGLLHGFCGCPVKPGSSFCPGHHQLVFVTSPVNEVKEEIAA